jgi:GTP-binding protein
MGRKNLQLVILILDIRRDPSEGEFSFVQWLCQYNIPFLFVLTKSDKLSRNQQLVRRRAIREFLGLASNPVLFSARTGEGKSNIWRHIRDILDHEHSPVSNPKSIP